MYLQTQHAWRGSYIHITYIHMYTYISYIRYNICNI